jgi:hypothetical protein
MGGMRKNLHSGNAIKHFYFSLSLKTESPVRWIITPGVKI